jgi:hypothetical protein
MEDKQQQVGGQGNTADPLPEAGPDREVWVRNQIFTAMRMALAVKFSVECGADETAFLGAIDGIANGVTVEILQTLGFSRDFINLRRPSYAAAKIGR